jgi:photosystem II stability/assembly factor-like uncharacterized protein
MKTGSTRRSLRPNWQFFCYLIVVFFLTFCFSAIAQSGLVAHYAFNGTFSDQTANGNHALPTGNPTFGTDRHGASNRAVKLGGCGNPQFLRVPNSPSLQVGDAMTVAFWATIDLSLGMDPGTGSCNENGRQVFFAKAGDGYGASPPGLLGLTYPADGQQFITFEANAGQANIQFAKELPGSTWHHYAYVLTTTEIKLYVDAQLVSTMPITLSFEAANQQDLYLGVMGPKSSPVLGVTSWYPLNGAMDDVRVFNRRLDASEISLVYASDDAGSCAPAAASILPAENQTICEGQFLTLKGVPPADVQLQWLKNGQPIAQGTLDSLVVSQSGNYRIETTRRQDVWKSEIGGFKTTMNDIQFVGGNYGWIVGEYGLFLRTTNGYSWDTIYTGRQDTFTSVNFVNTQVGFIGGSNGLLLKTTDGAASFSQLSIPVSGAIQKIKFLNDNTGYILADRLLFKSTNGGTTWTTVTLPTTFGVEDIAFVDADFGWIASGSQLYKTENGGSSWILQKDLDNNCSLKFQKLWALDRSSCWALYYNTCNGGYQSPNFVLRTFNSGSTWESYNIPVPSFYPSLSDLNPNAIIFTDAQNGYIVGRSYGRYFAMYGVNSGVILKTQNGGQSWTTTYRNGYNAFPVAISFRSSSQGYVVGRGGLMLSVNSSGSAYSQNPINRTLLPLKSVGGTSEIVFAVGGIQRTIEYGAHPDSKAVTLTQVSGQTWVKTETGFDFDAQGYPHFNGYTISQIRFKTDQFGWKVGYRIMSITKDGGNTWQSIFGNSDPRGHAYFFEKAYFQSDSTGFLLMKYNESNPATLFSFSGTTRTSIDIPYKDPSDPYTTRMLDLQFIDDNTGFITTSNGKLIKTTDGGTSWSVQLVKANTALNRCYFVTAQTGWVVGANGLMMKTINGGQSWITQNTGSTATWNGSYFLSAQEGYVVGTQGTLAKTSDGGNSWVSIVTNTRNTLNDLTFTTRDKGYIVGESGTILAFNPTLLPNCKATSAAVEVSISPGTLCETAASGAWDNLATWRCGHIPLVCDQVAINPGHVVTLSQSVLVRGIEVRQNGQLSMQGGNVLIQQ